MFTRMVYKTDKAEYSFKIVGNYREGFIANCEARWRTGAGGQSNGGPVALGRSIADLVADIPTAVTEWEATEIKR